VKVQLALKTITRCRRMKRSQE